MGLALWTLTLGVWLALGRPCAAAEDAPPPPSRSTELTAATFDELVTRRPEQLWLVEFWAPWCQHCQHLRPVWEQAAAALSDKLNFGTVDATVHKELAKRFAIRGYPTVLLVRGGRHRLYEGEKSVLGFADYALRMTSPAVHAQGSVAELRAALGPIGRAFVLAGPAPPPPLDAAFKAVADERHDELTFARVDGGAAAAELRAEGEPSGGLLGVLDGALFEPFVPPPGDDALLPALRAWVEARELPSVAAVSSANFNRLKRLAGKHLALALLDPSDLPAARAQQAQMAAHALAHRSGGALQFGWVDATELPKYWAAEYGVQPYALPTLLVLAAKGSRGSSADGHHWRARNGTDPLAGASEQAAFLDAILSGALEPERTGTPFSLLGILRTAYAGVRAFAADQPRLFCGCLALNVLFLAGVLLSGGGGGAAGLAPSAAAGRARGAKAD